MAPIFKAGNNPTEAGGGEPNGAGFMLPGAVDELRLHLDQHPGTHGREQDRRSIWRNIRNDQFPKPPPPHTHPSICQLTLMIGCGPYSYLKVMKQLNKQTGANSPMFQEIVGTSESAANGGGLEVNKGTSDSEMMRSIIVGAARVLACEGLPSNSQELART